MSGCPIGIGINWTEETQGRKVGDNKLISSSFIARRYGKSTWGSGVLVLL